MAGFKTHVTASALVGIGYGAGAYFGFDVPLPSCVLAAGLCGVSGMLPDLDSGPGRPMRESLAFAAAVVSTMLVDRFQQVGLQRETIVLAAVAAYVAVRFGLAQLLQRFTVHRGMFHSLPAMIIFGEIAFLLSSGAVGLRCYKAAAVSLGYLTHLVLDELYSVQYVRGRMALKKSFGSALKLFTTKRWWPNASTYAKLLLLTVLVCKEPGWMQQMYDSRIEPAAEQLAIDFDEFLQYMEEEVEAEAAAEAARKAAPPAPAPKPPETARRPLWDFDR